LEKSQKWISLRGVGNEEANVDGKRKCEILSMEGASLRAKKKMKE
jgi:hypothetical protein